jgi:integrase
VAPKEKRGIKLDEHEAIMAAEENAERRNYYQMLWETGAAQSDAAALSARNIDWRTNTLTYTRLKNGSDARLRIGPRLRAFLQQLPQEGPFFPNISQHSDSDRSAEFARRRRILGLTGISLHCYRYAWAERGLELGYPERYAQAALGHKSRAVHQAYAKKGEVICPSLEDYEGKIVPFQREPEHTTKSAASTGT